MKEVDIDVVADELAKLIPTFGSKFIRPMEKQVKEELPPMQLHVLIILKENASFTMTELSDKLKMSKQQMTPLIDKLIESKFVERQPDPVDRRVLRVSLTALGSDLLADIHKNITAMLKQRLECLNEDDLLSLHLALSEFYKIFHKIP